MSVCISCASPISARNQSGRCRACNLAFMNSDKSALERRRAGLLASLARPEVQARRKAALLLTMANLSPQEIERRRERGRVHACTILNDPIIRARSNSKEARAKAGRAKSETQLKWCPVELRDSYRTLMRKIGATEARRAIEAEIPGTTEHAHILIANITLGMQLKQERERGQAY